MHLQEIDVPEERLVVVGVVLDVVDGVGGLLLVESGKSLVCNLTEILASWPATPSNSFRFIFSLKILANCGLYDHTTEIRGGTICWCRRTGACLAGSSSRSVSKIEARGEVYGLKRLRDFPGAYIQGRYGLAIGTASTGDLWLEKGNGVIICLVAKSGKG